MNRQKTGRSGEQLAAAHLHQKGYEIVTTNWHCTRGEVDIIARDGDMLVFVEVKTRRSADTGDALVSMTPRKQQRLIAAAQTYMADHDLDTQTWRIDVVAVGLPYGAQPVVDHVEDALDW
ncbi:MAG: YraN family protein [Anaerolineae bacterium]|nr:YraN family protein [Anaerolineae bacterium]